mgnify:CR=1 FL=1
MIIQTIFTIILSIAIGLLMGIIGGGGGGIYVVILLVLLHQNAKTAAMTALFLSTITLSGAAVQYWRKKQVRIDYFIVLSVLDVVGTLIGNLILNHIDEMVLKVTIFSVLLLSGLSSFVKIKSTMNAQPNEVAEKLPITVPIGLISGLVTGTTGLSASTMLSSLLIGFLGFSPYLAVGTTTLVSFVGNAISIIVLVLSGFVLHTSVVYIDWKLILTLGLGSAVGAVLGAKLTTKINRKLLTFILAVMAIIPGIYLALSK